MDWKESVAVASAAGLGVYAIATAAVAVAAGAGYAALGVGLSGGSTALVTAGMGMMGAATSAEQWLWTSDVGAQISQVLNKATVYGSNCNCVNRAIATGYTNAGYPASPTNVLTRNGKKPTNLIDEHLEMG